MKLTAKQLEEKQKRFNKRIKEHTKKTMPPIY